MPKGAKALLYMVMCAAVALSATVARPDIAVAKPISKQEAAAAQMRILKKQAHRSQSAVRFWTDRERGRWMLHLRHKQCQDIKGKQRRKVCKHARKMLKFHRLRLVKLEAKIEKLSAPRETGYLPPSQAIELGRKMAAQYGWTGAQWKCLYDLWGRYESSWRVNADNPHSDAYGIPQALPGSKMGSGWRTSAYVQIRWGLRYIRGSFGSPCGALAYRLSNGYY